MSFSHEQLQQEVATKIGRAENTGRVLKVDLLDVLKISGYGKKSITGLIGTGVGCLDVEFGAEIFAFSAFHPRNFFVSEPNHYGNREEEITAVLAELSNRFHKVRLIRGNSRTVLAKFGTVGLLTWLNIFDDGFTGKDLITDVIGQSRNCLCQNGIFVFSFAENEASRVELFSNLADTTFPGFNLRQVDAQNSAGSIFLIGQKT